MPAPGAGSSASNGWTLAMASRTASGRLVRSVLPDVVADAIRPGERRGVDGEAQCLKAPAERAEIDPGGRLVAHPAGEVRQPSRASTRRHSPPPARAPPRPGPACRRRRRGWRTGGAPGHRPRSRAMPCRIVVAATSKLPVMRPRAWTPGGAPPVRTVPLSHCRAASPPCRRASTGDSTWPGKTARNRQAHGPYACAWLVYIARE